MREHGKGPVDSHVYADSRERRCAMSEPEARKPLSQGVTRERDKDDVLAAARPLPPDEDVLIEDLTEDEDHLFLAAVLDA
jgi:hypothetical protein